MHKILILDFGSQYTQLIARNIREQGVYCEIWSCLTPYAKIVAFAPKAIVFSGGPASVLQKGAPRVDRRVYDLRLPILGICYGMQLLTLDFGGKIVSAKAREYGAATLVCEAEHVLLKQVPKVSGVWMSHGDSLKTLAKNFRLLAATENGVPAVMADDAAQLYALQFHPEVHHTQFGKQILRNFLFEIARVRADWNMQDFIAQACAQIRATVGKDRVILGLSGGVDSSVAAALLHKAIGDQLTCIFVDNGLLREGETKQVQAVFRQQFRIKLKTVDATRVFLAALKNVKDPEKKRKIIGRVFVRVFEAEAKKIKNARWLAQGTLYPDVIESISFQGPSVVIKSHHNVGGLPKKMGLKLVEPLRELFKDEVRALGRKLNLPEDIIGRHPFPGPGLAIRILGKITPERLALLRKADQIFIEEIRKASWYDKIWQALVVLLPVQSVGVMGDERTYENVCALRAVNSVDGMTANWVDLPHELLKTISTRIINEVKGINRVVYDVSSKPPATIEWE